jgi:hypothetical protein
MAKQNDSDLNHEIASFYRRWHDFESSQQDNAQVIDFDFWPGEIEGNYPRFDNRFGVFKSLGSIQERLAAADPKDFSNHTFLTQKLKGSNAYLRALMGERIPFQEYISATLGFQPVRLDESMFAAMVEDLQEPLTKKGITWRSEDAERYREATNYGDPRRFGEEIRRRATYWVEKVRQMLGLEVEPHYTVEEASEDEYWTNWIDGGLKNGIRLRVNVHPRIRHRKGQDIGLAAHEIAGHALQIFELNDQRCQGKIDPVSMLTTVHTCELFQQEGLAQSVIHLVGEMSEFGEDFLVQDMVEQYHLAVLQNAHLDLEEGRSVAEVIDHVLGIAPFIEERRVISDLRDRSRSPFFRALMFVYYPSKVEFLRARQLPKEVRQTFLRSQYQQFHTPGQISMQLDELLGEKLVGSAQSS